ncbi:hypothetical protein GobsT_50170 [Gemmata obscuriglobus]|uniref:Uncharacterized protein n=1 Tax=Gemmata obscuriglobus TaxID=114 RepID=A0A2Z3GYE9_9BACT|nr:hypothetical protein [Gemmata obscuriglobus]AWM37072.1 hypothetical protein C1280_08575 [Gemmata obscuriglobus]QEG30214.1 hypothetical protein GobsT_50170 [Gemmata obscuriglobus]VTS09538.1 unnamed protein product [Gemmata obscuriglobus UQM 2246]
MTRTFRVSLGSSTLSGKQAIDQVRQFRHQLCSLFKKPDAVTLLTVEDVETRSRGLVAFFDADNPCAVSWVKQAEAISGELWQTLAERRKGVAR